ncbi:MAG: hypothetical protein ACFCU3_01340 [Verrucomicrobiales bacterium]
MTEISIRQKKRADSVGSRRGLIQANPPKGGWGWIQRVMLAWSAHVGEAEARPRATAAAVAVVWAVIGMTIHRAAVIYRTVHHNRTMDHYGSRVTTTVGGVVTAVAWVVVPPTSMSRAKLEESHSACYTGKSKEFFHSVVFRWF